MFFMFFFPNMGSKNRGGKKYTNLISSFSSNTINWNKKKPATRTQPLAGAHCFDLEENQAEKQFLPRQSVLFISNLNKIIADYDGKL